ncbi:uncharacterized protein B0P05DRAFT_641493 [Gilbertella persicaria]|uniref:uncharacterized protein n=1 Tax=Gilbertella persicaria TaxID=101096 RepID=UPI00221E70BE|nr:uncharacterized protein B0P05DRAFT_641493 [Gilbertella persicaria]KAI8052566.1 hypothetical protein B0P05DRAFT_641493 [Gilbertella persicaria]
MNKHDLLHKVPEALPRIPVNSGKSTIKSIITEYATRNNFTVVGDQYKSTHGLSATERKRIIMSSKTSCPYQIRFSRKKNDEGFNITALTSEEDCYHNHPLDENKTHFGQWLNKLSVSDINYIGYANDKRKQSSFMASEKATTEVIKAMENKGYTVSYRFNDLMTERTARFSEVVIIDATYGTDNLKMPLICAYGVSDVGRPNLVTFPIAFALFSNQNTETYLWFLQNLKGLSSTLRKNYFGYQQVQSIEGCS